MTSIKMYYRKISGYKYDLSEDLICQISVKPPKDIKTKFIELSTEGVIIVRKGYAWDGCSGPTFDSDTNMRAGLLHDCLYQLMRMGLLNQEFRPAADMVLQETCLQDGMARFRAWYFYEAVRKFGYGSAKLSPVQDAVSLTYIAP